jgi:hypothetical protein
VRIERLISCTPEELWRALIQHAELGECGAMLRLALPGGLSEYAGPITVYESGKILECAWGCNLLRWEVHARGEATLLAFNNYLPDPALWVACVDSIAAEAVGNQATRTL